MPKRKQKDKPVKTTELTPERIRHGDVIEREETAKAGQYTHRNRTQTILDRYLHRGQITAEQHGTGCRIHALYRASECSPLRASNLDGVGGGGGITTAEQAEARRRLSAIWDRVGWVSQAILVHVCIADLPAGRRFNGLKIALDKAS